MDRSAEGWDQVIQSLTQLAFTLVDTVANQGSYFASNTPKLRTSGEVSNAGSKISNLAITILSQLFKHHDVVRSEILEQITSRIMTRSNSAIDFIKLLDNIIRDHPYTIEKYLSSVGQPNNTFFFLICFYS